LPKPNAWFKPDILTKQLAQASKLQGLPPLPTMTP
jgi:hypothetical protein